MIWLSFDVLAIYNSVDICFEALNYSKKSRLITLVY